MDISMSALFVPENLASRDGFGSPVPRQPAHHLLRNTQAESGSCIRDFSRVISKDDWTKKGRGFNEEESIKPKTKQNKTNITHQTRKTP